MTETSGFMDPGTYDAAQFARALFGIVKDGYMDGYLNELQVIAATPNAMSVVVKTGAAWVQGAWYINDAAYTLTIDTAHASLDRIDRIILRKTATTDIVAAVLKGTAAASPSAPSLSQTTDGTWEISLAQVLVTHAVTSIAGTGTTLITDERTPAYGTLGGATIKAGGELDMGGLGIDMGTSKITALSDGTADTDAVNKGQMDTAISDAIDTGIPGRLVAYTVHAAGSSGTHTTNAAANKVFMTLIGGGGGGGAGYGGANYAGGAGGGCYRVYVNNVTVSPSTGYTYAVGSGGNGGSGSSDGSAGGNTTFAIGGTTYASNGGGGGVHATSSGAGAAGSTGTKANESQWGNSEFPAYGNGGAGGAYGPGSVGGNGILIVIEYS